MGIIGLPGSGKTTIFETLTGDFSEGRGKGEKRIGMVEVPDARVDRLVEIYRPKKITPARVEYLLPGPAAREGIWAQVRDCDALIHVVRNFTGTLFEDTSPGRDFQFLEEEMILSDLSAVENKLEKLELARKKGREIDREELDLLGKCREKLSEGLALRSFPELASAPVLKGFAFASGKPLLVLFNNEDDDDNPVVCDQIPSREFLIPVKGRLEHELARMGRAEAADFLEEYRIGSPAMDRVIRKSYRLLGLISFFTVGPDEVRAWTVRQETAAAEAATVIHSDIKRGFIRAEVLAYDDLMAAGTFPAARKKGTVRLEGKTYPVRDGDIIDFRFNV